MISRQLCRRKVPSTTFSPRFTPRKPSIPNRITRQSSSSTTSHSPPTSHSQLTYHIPAPLENSGPLLSRRPDRALPPLPSSSAIWLKTLPIFIGVITISALGLFNYQKSSSSTVASILYALRTNKEAREELGDEVYFASKWPWISGELNQLHGRIDVSFWVKGTKGVGRVRFVSTRRRRNELFRTQEWSLEMEDGRVLQLLDSAERDPLQQ